MYLIYLETFCYYKKKLKGIFFVYLIIPKVSITLITILKFHLLICLLLLYIKRSRFWTIWLWAWAWGTSEPLSVYFSQIIFQLVHRLAFRLGWEC